MILAAGRLFRISVAAQIGGHHGELVRQSGCHFMPRHVRERIAVHEQKRGSTAAVDRHDARTAGLDFRTGEAFEHPLNALLPV